MEFDPPPHGPGDEESVSPLQRILSRVCECIHIGEYSRSLELMTQVRAIHRGNIYLDTMATQIELLLSLTGNKTLTEEQRTQILDTLPSLVECATVEAEETTDISTDPVTSTDETADRRVVVANLVNDFLTNVDQCINKGEYEKALVEIQRIYRIDPQNATAKALEQTIARMAGNTGAPIARSGNDPTERPPGDRGRTSRVPAPSADLPAPAPEPVVKPLPRQELRSIAPPPPKQRPTILIATLGAAIVGFGILILVQSMATDMPPATSAIPNARDSKPSTIAVRERETDIQALPKDTVKALPAPSVGVPDDGVAERRSPAVVIRDQQQPKDTQRTALVVPEVPQKGTAESGRPLAVANHAAKEPTSPAVIPEQKPAAPPSVSEPEPEPAVPSQPFVAVQKDPQILRLEKPVIPDRVFMTGKSVQVLVRVQIGPDGRPLQAKIVKSSNPLANDAIINAVMKSEYSPGIMSSGPVTTWVSIPFSVKK
jgi:protein TonB